MAGDAICFALFVGSQLVKCAWIKRKVPARSSQASQAALHVGILGANGAIASILVEGKKIAAFRSPMLHRYYILGDCVFGVDSGGIVSLAAHRAI